MERTSWSSGETDAIGRSHMEGNPEFQIAPRCRQGNGMSIGTQNTHRLPSKKSVRHILGVNEAGHRSEPSATKRDGNTVHLQPATRNCISKGCWMVQILWSRRFQNIKSENHIRLFNATILKALVWGSVTTDEGKEKFVSRGIKNRECRCLDYLIMITLN